MPRRARSTVSRSPRGRCPRLFRTSTHLLGVAEAVELGRELDRLPQRLTVYGIEGERFDVGEGLSATSRPPSTSSSPRCTKSSAAATCAPEGPQVSEEPLYPKIVVGFADTESGEDARAMGERLVEADGGELEVLHFEKGSPAARLREMAERGDADLIVLGSTHHAAFGSVAPGSVAEQLLKGTPARLLIAPRGFAQARAMREAQATGEEAADVPRDHPLPLVRDELRVIAVGFNGSVESRVALDEATVLARKFGATIRVVAVARARAAARWGPRRRSRRRRSRSTSSRCCTRPARRCPRRCGRCRSSSAATRSRSCWSARVRESTC